MVAYRNRHVIFCFYTMLLVIMVISTSCNRSTAETNINSSSASSDLYESTSPFGRTFDLHTHVRIHDLSQVDIVRQTIIDTLWQQGTLPDLLPDVTTNITNGLILDQFVDLADLERIDKLSIKMDYEFTSVAYHFRAANPNGALVLYHQGHSGDFDLGRNTIQYFLSEGYDVVGLSMPGTGKMYPYPETIMSSELGLIHLDRGLNSIQPPHSLFVRLEPIIGNGLRFFVEPSIAVINYAIQEGYNHIAMTGISGGGWTTAFVAAIDTRVRQSYPVAGTYPFYLRYDLQDDLGDWEQFLPSLAPEINYFDLYTLASIGENRQQHAIYNKYDSCCFYGLRSLQWSDVFGQHIASLGGTYQVMIDDTHERHDISVFALNLIAKELNASSSK